MDQKLNIGIVARNQEMGVAVYTHNLIRALATLPPEERPRVTLFCAERSDLFDEVEPLVDRLILYRPLLEAPPTRKVLYALRYLKTAITVFLLGEAQPELAFAARRAGVDAVYAVTNSHTRLLPNAIAWIPDLQNCALPHLFSVAERKSRDYRFSRLLHDPRRHVVFSSHHALDHARDSYGPISAHTHVMHFATVPEPSWSGDIAPVLKRYDVPKQYLMACNVWAVHKDHETLIRAIALLRRNGTKVNVVCTGANWERRRPEHFAAMQALIRDLELEPQFTILGLIPRLDQVMLIRGASAIIQPSRFEGWSTVIEDARAVGTPVIASDFPVHVEQNVPGTIFFQQGDPEDCARAIREHLKRGSRPAAAVNGQMERVAEFGRKFVSIVRATSVRNNVSPELPEMFHEKVDAI
jgi:glycosyltransferase involved in cell wall biosynthesis